MEMETIVKIRSIAYVTHDVKCFRIAKPSGYMYVPGQATELSVNKEGWKDKRSPFTFTSLPDAPYLEFTIKIYAEHQGVTNQLSLLNEGDELLLRESWGAIEYKGPGYFIAGGAGITPFLSILRDLQRKGEVANNVLFYSNKTEQDIILADELKTILCDKAHFTISRQKESKYDQRRIDADFLKAEVTDFSKYFYVCGPDAMVAAITETLKQLGARADSLVFEK